MKKNNVTKTVSMRANNTILRIFDELQKSFVAHQPSDLVEKAINDFPDPTEKLIRDLDKQKNNRLSKDKSFIMHGSQPSGYNFTVNDRFIAIKNQVAKILEKTPQNNYLIVLMLINLINHKNECNNSAVNQSEKELPPEVFARLKERVEMFKELLSQIIEDIEKLEGYELYE
jgi:hypothetical protein